MDEQQNILTYHDRNIHALEGLLEVVTTVPTHEPTKFEQQVKIYVDSLTLPTIKRLYVYNNRARAWHYYDQDATTPVLSAKGDLLTRTSSALTALNIGANTKVLVANSADTKGMNWAYAPITYDSGTAEVTVTNTTNETALYSKQITGNDMGTTGGFMLHMIGTLVNNVAGQGIVYRIKFGSTTVATLDSTVSIGNTANSRNMVWKIWCSNVGATNSQVWGGEIWISNAGSSGAWEETSNTVSKTYINILRGFTSTVDTTSNQTFSITADPSSASSSLTTTRDFATLFKF